MEPGKRAVLTIVLLMMEGVCAADGGQYIYREITADAEQMTRVTIAPGQEMAQVEIEYFDSIYTITADASLKAQECRVTSRVDERTTVFRRRGKFVVIRSDTTSSVKSVKDLPWHQTPFTLAEFIKSGDSKLKFLTATVSDLADDGDKPGSMLTMVAKNHGLETIDLDGQSVSADRVTMTLSGIKSLFWKITYWYRPVDGVVLMYKEARGGPGTPDTHGVLISEEVLR
jgi:hypothetical protein